MHILDDIGCIYMIIYYDIPVFIYHIYIYYIYIYTNTVNLFTKRTPCIGCLLKWSHRAFRTALQELRELTNATVRDYHKAYYRLRRDPKPLEATCSEDLMNMHERGSCTTKCIIRIYIIYMYICNMYQFTDMFYIVSGQTCKDIGVDSPHTWSNLIILHRE